MKTEILKPNKKNLLQAAQSLKEGEVVAFATETVYGLGACLYNETSIQKIFHLKNRPADNPLIVHINDIKWVYELAQDIPDDFFILSEKFFPGPLTLILPKKSIVSSLVTANHPTVAFRMPNAIEALDLITKVGQPLVAPSANLSGKPSATKAEHVLEDFDGKIPYIIDCGPCSYGIESTVIYLADKPILLRYGAITREKLEQVLKKKIIIGHHLNISPGMKYKHYAPNASVKLFTKKNDLINYALNFPLKKLILSSEPIENIYSYQLDKKTLYDFFRKADKTLCKEVLIYCNDQDQRDLALIHRIEKASSKL